MTISVNNSIVNSNSPISDGALGSVNSVQMLFALVQMELSKEHKDNAKSMIESVKSNQAISKQYAEVIAKLNGLDKDVLAKFDKFPNNIKDLDAKITDCQSIKANYQEVINNAKAGKQPSVGSDSTHGKLYALDSKTYEKFKGIVSSAGNGNFADFTRGNDNKHFMYELEGGIKEIERYEQYCQVMRDAVNIGLPTSFLDGKIDDKALQRMITSLQGLQEEYGTKNQTLMVQIQDMLGQYNANLQGANSAVQQSNNVLQSLSKGG